MVYLRFVIEARKCPEIWAHHHRDDTVFTILLFSLCIYMQTITWHRLFF